MSDQTLELFCLIVGDDPLQQNFAITIDKKKRVSELKSLIKAANTPSLNNLAAKELTLWIVSISFDDVMNRVINDLLINSHGEVDGRTSLYSHLRLSDVFPENPVSDRLHILITIPCKFQLFLSSYYFDESMVIC